MVIRTAPRAGHHEDATDERVWSAWTGWQRLKPARLPGPGARVVVLAAHPDDDVLAVGGLLTRLARVGCDLLLLTATDGEASHPVHPTVTRPELAERRNRELDAALAELGCASIERVRLHLPDAALAGRESELADRLGSHFADAVLVLAPWAGDGHPDHEAAGRAARRAVRDLVAVPSSGGGGGSPARLWEYPLWAWHWAEPGTDELPWGRARTVWLDPTEQAAKRAAIACFDSQLYPLGDAPGDVAVLPPPVLAHFDRSLETVLT